MMKRVPPWLSNSVVRKYLNYKDLFPVMEEALASLSRGGDVVQPIRTTMPIENGYCMVMPALSVKYDAIVTKVLMRHRQGPAVKNQVLIYMALTSGQVLAIMEANLFSGIRTAAVSAIATKYLAPEPSTILAIIGSGEQASSHIQALRHMCNFKQVRLFSRNRVNAENLSKKLSCKVCQTVEETVRGADVIVTATTSRTPVLKAEWVKNGAHINCIGACIETMQELDPELMRTSTVYTDTKEGAMKESGDIIQSGITDVTELGELILGRKRANRNITTVFKPMGMALEDLVAAKLVYDKYNTTSNL